jgi:hypothetical protein
MKDVGKFCLFYCHLVFVVVIWYLLWLFGIFCGNLVYFYPFWNVLPRKIWQPWSAGGAIEEFFGFEIGPTLSIIKFEMIFFKKFRFNI